MVRRNILSFILVFGFLHLTYIIPSFADISKCKKRNGNFPKPGSYCRSYYICHDWKPVEMMCPEEQHFFPAKGYCVHSEMYPCFEKPKSEECPRLHGKFPRPGTLCKIFYDCNNGIATEKRCPGDQLFDPDKEACEWPEIYTCVENPKSKECSRLNGKFLKPGTGCRIFYDCNNGIPTERRCPGDQLFDPVKEKCEWPEIYTCIEDVNKTKSTASVSISTISIITASETTTTEKNVITTTITPKSTPTKPTTDSDEDSSEEGKSSEEDKQSSTKAKTKSTTPKISTPSTSSSDGKTIISRISTSSNKVTEKSSELPMTASSMVSSPVSESRTKVNTIITESITTVTYPDTVTDESTVSTEPSRDKDTYSTTKSPDTTNSITSHIFCPDSDGHFPHPNDRHKFIACVGGIPIVMECPEKLVYDHKKRACEYDKI